MAYQLEESILEVCTCNILCPCWVGEDPDPGTCDAAMVYHFDKGNITMEWMCRALHWALSPISQAIS